MIHNPEMECMDRESMRKLQSERLQKVVKNCYENVPFYRKKMDRMGVTPEQIRSIDDIVKLPFTTKHDLRDEYPFGLQAVPQSEIRRIHASSGTTGKPVVGTYTENDLKMWAECVARVMAVGDVGPGDVVQVAYGYGLFTGGLGAHDGAAVRGAIQLPISAGNSAKQIMLMKDFGTTALCCTPSYALHLAEVIEQHPEIKAEDLKLRVGFFGAEPWTWGIRRELEKKLHIKAIDIYGLTEMCGPGVGGECLYQNGTHVAEDMFYPEIINPETGEVLPDGEKGELVFTCITKEAFPLLRYRTRDICVLTREKCSCGRTHVKMCKPRGRSDDMLIIRGVNVFPSQIETVLLNKGYPANYQIIVDRVNHTDTLDVQVEMTPEMFTDNLGEIARRQKDLVDGLRAMLGLTAKVTLVAPKSIVRSEGKAVRVIDKRKI